MRLACFGWVDEWGGSIASAGHLLLRELLARGVQVELYAHHDHVAEPAGLKSREFRYFGFAQPRWLDAIDRLPRELPRMARKLVHPMYVRSWRHVYAPVAGREHKLAPYDAVLGLGTLPQFTLHGVPTIAWRQGPPHTELEAIRRLRDSIVRLNGPLLYAGLVAAYVYDERIADRFSLHTDHVIVGSQWSRQQMIAKGTPPERVDALPYPIDLDAFRAASDPDQDWDQPTLLWLGRMDPRKRLDLLLNALPLVLDVIPGARLKIVGRPTYTPKVLTLLDRTQCRERIEYVPAVPRRQVPSLLQDAAVLVQPSENEDFGSSVAEALACGTQVVVGTSNGTAEYVDESSGVFNSYTPESVAAAIVATIQRRREAPHATQLSARASAERWFSPRGVVQRLLELLEGVVSTESR